MSACFGSLCPWIINYFNIYENNFYFLGRLKKLPRVDYLEKDKNYDAG